MAEPSVAGISLILETNDQVDEIARFLGAVGLEVQGEDGNVEVKGPQISLTAMKGAMVPVPPLGGVLLHVTFADAGGVDTAAHDAAGSGGAVALGPANEWGTYSAFVTGPAGLTVELSSPLAA
jgi:hypothetical protein